MTDDRDAGESPLERYLRQKENERKANQAAGAVTDGREAKEIPVAVAGQESGLHSSVENVADLNLKSIPQAAVRMGGFGARLLAWLIDQVVLSTLTTPLALIFSSRTSEMVHFLQLGQWREALSLIVELGAVSLIVKQLIVLAYYGWFYVNRGATPGKLLLDVRLINSETGARCGYGRAFIREALVKPYISGFLTLGLGYLIAAFRSDGRALHDLICATFVIKPPTDQAAF